MKLFRLWQPLALLCIVMIALCLSTSALQASGSEASTPEAKVSVCLNAPLANTHIVQRTVTRSHTYQTAEPTTVVARLFHRHRATTQSSGCATNCNCANCNCGNQQVPSPLPVGPVAPPAKPAPHGPHTAAPVPAPVVAPAAVARPQATNVFQRTVTRTHSRSSTCANGLCTVPR